VPADDTLAKLNTGAVQGAVKAYTGKASADDLKPLTDVDALIETGKAKAGEGLTYTYADKKPAFAWVYTSKKKLDAAQEKGVETALTGVLVKAIDDQKAALKLDAAGVTAATAAAKTTKFTNKYDAGSGVGVDANVVGELPLSGLTDAALQDSVRTFLAAKPDTLGPIENFVYTAPVKTAEGLTVAVADGKPAFTWKVEPRQEKLDADQMKTVATQLKIAVERGLASEKVKAKKLKPDDLKAATEAVKDLKVEPLPYSKVRELKSATFNEWVKAYVKAYPTAYDALTGKVEKGNLQSLKTEPGVDYRPESKTVYWRYQPAAGAPADPAVAVALREVLTKAIEKGVADAKYPADDKDKILAYTYVVEPRSTTPELELDDVDQDKVREMVRKYFTNPLPKGIGSVAARREMEILQNLGVAVLAPGELDQLIRIVSYKTVAGKPVFEWRYAKANPSAQLNDQQKEDIANRLRAILTAAVETGGGEPYLKISKMAFAESFVEPLKKATFTPIDQFSLAQYGNAPDMAREVLRKQLANPSADRDALRGKVDYNDLPEGRVFAFDVTGSGEKVAIALKIPTAKDRPPLTAKEQDEVKAAAVNLLAAAFAAAQDDPKRSLNDAEYARLKQAVKDAAVTILTPEQSVNERELIEQGRRIAEQKDRIDDLERRLASLEEAVRGLNGKGTGPQYMIKYVEKRSGFLGCHKTMVPVVCQVP